MKCYHCGKLFDGDDATNVGTFWQPIFAAICPDCGAENRFELTTGSFDIDHLISEMVDHKHAAKKHEMPLEKRVKRDAVLEYWVQQYIAANHARLGFGALEGPFDIGPDFRVLHKGKWVLAEAEVVCENYIEHKHHENKKWAACDVLIVLSEKEPDQEAKKLLPKTVIHIDKAHFTPWYRAAAREYALAREKEEPLKKASEKINLQLKSLAGEIRKRFGVPYGGDDMSLFDELALKFVERWIEGNEREFKLTEIPPAAIDEFCRNQAPYVRERGANIPVFYSRYCKKCDKTLIIRSSRMKGFADYENVRCP